MLTKGERLQLKAATHLMVREAGGQEACAMASDRIERHQSFSDYADRKKLDKFICIDTVAEIERFAGQPIVTRTLAELSGHVLIPLPVVPGSAAKIDLITAKAVQSFGQMLAELAEAKADGAITPDEAKELHPQIAELITKLVKLDRQIEAVSQVESEAP